MNRWTIGKKLFAGIGVLIALLLASGWLSIRNGADLNARLGEVAGSVAKQIEHSNNVEVMAGAVNENALEMMPPLRKTAPSLKKSARVRLPRSPAWTVKLRH